jgi:hypothetical protein
VHSTIAREAGALTEGIQWLVDLDNWDTGIMFARGIPPEELAVRMGAAPGSALPPLTEAEVWQAAAEPWRPPGQDGDGMIRVGASEGWSFAVEYGDCGGPDSLEDVSRGGVEVVRLDPQPEHPPKVFSYGLDGKPVCSFGIGEEVWRWGSRPDLLVPELTAAGILRPDGTANALLDDAPFRDRDRRTLAVIEEHFGLSLPWELVIVGHLPAYELRGAPDISAWVARRPG